jgi:hypothetical protein
MANAMALATAAGGIAIFSIDARICDRTSGRCEVLAGVETPASKRLRKRFD